MNEQATEAFKSLVPLSTEALKSVLLLNGGAVVALLAYLGQAHSRVELARSAGWPLTCFTLGLVFATLAFGSAYLTQLTLFNEVVHGDRLRGPTHKVWLRATFVLALSGLAAFVAGAFASRLLKKHRFHRWKYLMES